MSSISNIYFSNCHLSYLIYIEARYKKKIDLETRTEKKYCGYGETGEDQNGRIKWRGKERRRCEGGTTEKDNEH